MADWIDARIKIRGERMSTGPTREPLSFVDLVEWLSEGRAVDTPMFSTVPELKPVCDAFRVNYTRTGALALVTVRLMATASIVADARHHAAFDILKRTYSGPEDNPYIESAVFAHLEMLELFSFLLKDKDAETAAIVDRASSHSIETHQGVNAIFSSMVIGTWTTIETFLRDLWEAALNCHPKKLSLLQGKPNDRIHRKAMGSYEDDPDEDEGEKRLKDKDSIMVYLNEIQNVTGQDFDLRKRMGTLLRRRFKFDTLKGIREAYSRAFRPSDGIDTFLADDAIDAVNIVRNSLVHAAGIADHEFVRRAKSLPLAPATKAGERIQLTGTNVKSMLAPALIACSNLLSAVEKRITKTKPKSDPDVSLDAPKGPE